MRWTFIDPSDQRWRAALARTRHDVYHLPEYTTLCGKYEDAEPLAFYAEEGDSVCLIPFLRKGLPEEVGPALDWCDVVSPYGYPGPVYSRGGEERAERFLGALGSAADEAGACSVFLRLHPLFAGETKAAMALSACVRHGETVSIDLTHSEEELWQQTRKDHRAGIRHIERMNFSPVMDDWNLYGDFAQMYRQTMARLGADRFYHFSNEYFADLRAGLGDHLHLCCILSPEGRPVAGALFTTCSGIMGTHLSGSDPDYHRLAPKKLVIHFARLWGKQHGCSVLHLGGGVGGRRDTVFDFKAGFSPNRREFWTLRMIPNEARYAALTSRTGLPLNPSADLEVEYFPPYRRRPLGPWPIHHSTESSPQAES